MAKGERAEGYEWCPGCYAVDHEGKPCDPHNARYCPIAAFLSRKAELDRRKQKLEEGE